jgi:hypothetical protein
MGSLPRRLLHVSRSTICQSQRPLQTSSHEAISICIHGEKR